MQMFPRIRSCWESSLLEKLLFGGALVLWLIMCYRHWKVKQLASSPSLEVLGIEEFEQLDKFGEL
jgi:hypothetical protein